MAFGLFSEGIGLTASALGWVLLARWARAGIGYGVGFDLDEEEGGESEPA